MIKGCSLVVAVCLLATTGVAQDIQTKGALRGTIADINGAVISNAKVTVMGQQSVDRVVATNDEGVFEVDNLTPGLYNVKAEQRDFKTASVSGVEIFVGKATAIKLILEVGSITEVVDVSRSEEHTSELQSLAYLVCRLLLEKKKFVREI